MDPDERDYLERQNSQSQVHLRRVLSGFLSILTFVVVILTIVVIVAVAT